MPETIVTETWYSVHNRNKINFIMRFFIYLISMARNGLLFCGPDIISNESIPFKDILNYNSNCLVN